MASLVVGAVGAAAGGAFFGPLGASIGWMVGSAVGSMLDPPKQSGPRLTDLKLQNSQYGQMRPILYGSARMAGNVIWQTDLVEHSHKQGGKGGPKITTYTYTASFAVRLCDGPIAGVLRIWADSKLIYDTTGGQKNLAAIPLTVYLGTETQLADPTMEVALGVGNVNANRGVAYCVFTDWDLGDYGNRIPSLTFEVCSTVDAKYGRVTAWETAAPESSITPPYAVAYDGTNIMRRVFAHATSKIHVSTTVYTELGAVVSTDERDVTPAIAPVGPVFYCNNNPHWYIIGSGGDDPNLGALYHDFEVVGATIPWHYVRYAGGRYTCSTAFDSSVMFVLGDVNTSATGGGGGAVLRALDLATSPGALMAAVTFDPTSQGNQFCVSVDNADGTVWVSGYGNTWHYSFSVGDGFTEIAHWAWASLGFNPATDLRDYTFCGGRWAVPVVGGYYDALSVNIGTISPNAPYLTTIGGILYTSAVEPIGPAPAMSLGPCIGLGDGLAWIRDGLISVCGDSPGSAVLSDIVASLSQKAGLAATDYNVAELTDVVPGYIVSQQMTARSAIEPLTVAYHFDAVESDAIVKFPKRGRAPVATVDDDDLGAFDSGGAPPAQIVTTRLQDVDLPRQVSVVYFDRTADYQQGTQNDLRSTATQSSESLLTIQLPIVMSAQEARGIAQAQLMNAWVERDHWSTALPTKYAYLDPSDVITVRGQDCRIVSEDAEPTARQALELVRSLPFVWFSTGSGGTSGSGFTPQTVTPAQLADLVMLDIPVIADPSQQSIYYAAAAGVDRPAWKGGDLFKSLDGGVTYASTLSTNDTSSIGEATTVLGNFSGNWFDELNSVTVFLHAGAGDLESVSTINVLNGANLAVLGSEIIQFRTATLTAPQTYVLTGLLRGRHGTEFATGTHAVGETFVLLPVNTVIPEQSGDLYNARHYKMVTNGTSLAAATDVPFTYNGTPLRCFAPVQLGGGRDGSGNITLNWTRRARVNAEWIDGTDVPLDETAESYEVAMYSTGSYGTPVATYTATAPTFSYTATAQTSDFGSAVDPLYWSVAQVSTNRVGPGTKAYGVT